MILYKDTSKVERGQFGFQVALTTALSAQMFDWCVLLYLAILFVFSFLSRLHCVPVYFLCMYVCEQKRCRELGFQTVKLH